VCIYVGVAISLPIIVYQFLQFIRPLMRNTTARFVFVGSAVSGIIALLGIVFGYFIGLPAALNFLFHSFHNPQVQALITIQAYMSFVTAYLLGSALMFQLPLFLIFINRIKPLKPGTLLKYERHVIIGSVIVGFIMNPSPNLLSQAIVVLPIILMYQVGIGIVWLINRNGRGDKFTSLLNEDLARRAERSQQAAQLLPVLQAEQADLTRPRRELELADTEWSQSLAKTATENEPSPVRVVPRAQYDTSPAVALASQMQSGPSIYQQTNIPLSFDR
jgi:sec-independent protein translocase protein TatC